MTDNSSLIERLERQGTGVNLTLTDSRKNGREAAQALRDADQKLAIEGDHPFPDDFTALDIAVERNKSLLAENESLQARVAELEADKRRMDYLESEAIREIDLQAPRSLFRRNMPITRAAVDEARQALKGDV